MLVKVKVQLATQEVTRSNKRTQHNTFSELI